MQTAVHVGKREGGEELLARLLVPVGRGVLLVDAVLLPSLTDLPLDLQVLLELGVALALLFDRLRWSGRVVSRGTILIGSGLPVFVGI